MRQLEVETRGIVRQERRLLEYTIGAKLCRMLRNTLLKWPMAQVKATAADFGVLLDEHTYLLIRTSGKLTTLEKRDLLALFATWLVVKPEALAQEALESHNDATMRSGVL
jgi:hypothetical protein